MSDGQILTTPPPLLKGLHVTDEDWAEILTRADMATELITGYVLDAFQSCRLKHYWWVLHVIDSSGYSSGKTIVDVLWAVTRCILIPGRRIGVYYPTGTTGRETFWTYIEKFVRKEFGDRYGIIQAHLSEDGLDRDNSCHKAVFKNGSIISMPAPSFMKDASTQASLRFHDMIIEEWTHIDAQSDGINKQLLGRPTEETWNQHHPFWGNHLILSAPAKTKSHPAYDRYEEFAKSADEGDPQYAVLHYNHKDYSNLIADPLSGETFKHKHRNDAKIKLLKKNLTDPSEWLGEGLGIWGQSGQGWFSEAAMLKAQELGRQRMVTPVTSRRQMEELMMAQ